MSGAVREDPPTPRTGRNASRWKSLADTAKANPGEWFRDAEPVKDGSTGHVLLRLRDLGCDAMSSRTACPEPGRSYVYARWVGQQ